MTISCVSVCHFILRGIQFILKIIVNQGRLHENIVVTLYELNWSPQRDRHEAPSPLLGARLIG